MKQIRELRSELFALAENTPDHRWRSWAKSIESIDDAGKGVMMFRGEFVDKGTIEIENKPQLFLVGMEIGSAKYHDYEYDVIRMLPDGTLEHTGITADGAEKGWNLTIREDVRALLNEIAQAPDVQKFEVEMTEEAMQALHRLYAALGPAVTEHEIIRVAILRHDMYVQEKINE